MGTSTLRIKLLLICLLAFYSLPTFAVVNVEAPIDGMIDFQFIGNDAQGVGGLIANVIKKLSIYVSIISVIAIIF